MINRTRQLLAALLDRLGRALVGSASAPMRPTVADAVPAVPEMVAELEARRSRAVAASSPGYQGVTTDSRRWVAFPGGVLELAQTGFLIGLNADPALPPYMLRDPEGRWLAVSADLQTLKGVGEKYARDRDEFLCIDRSAADVIERLRRNGH